MKKIIATIIAPTILNNRKETITRHCNLSVYEKEKEAEENYIK